MACSMKRLRFNVPIEDDEVLAWLSQQSSVSVSLRMLVHDAIREHGEGDYVTKSVKRDNKVKTPKRESVEKKVVTKSQQNSATDAISRMQGLLDN
ncbi:MAG: hypothetical protein KH433_00735 [Campylobacter concisus]|nr:hypothetical protein [Campylobacter concisus]